MSAFFLAQENGGFVQARAMPRERLVCFSEHRFLVQYFDFVARPRRFAEEGKRAFHARIVFEAVDANPPRKLVPSVFVDQLFEHHLERDAVQRVVGMQALFWFVVWHVRSLSVVAVPFHDDANGRRKENGKRFPIVFSKRVRVREERITEAHCAAVVREEKEAGMSDRGQTAEARDHTQTAESCDRIRAVEACDHTQAVEVRTRAIRISPRDHCAFFRPRNALSAALGECWYCAWSDFDRESDVARQGLCKFKQ